MSTVSGTGTPVLGTAGPGTATHCPYCSLQCGIDITIEEGRPHIEPRDFPTNRGGLCQKGWTAAELLDHPDRLLKPLLRDRKGGELHQCSWKEALDRIAREITALQELHGKNAIGVFGGGGLTNEKGYALGKFARVALGTSMIDYNGRFCMSSAATALNAALGIDRGLPFPLSDIPGAQTVLLVGSNIAETMPPVMRYFDEQKRNGGDLIVVDPRRTPTAAGATIHLQITPGTDVALANGLLHIILKERYYDEEFIRERTTGFEEVKRTAASYWPQRVERITGISERQLTDAAHLVGRASSCMILTARGAEQQSRGVDNVLGFINLSLATGRIGKPHCGFGCLTGQGNGQGGREHGQKSDQLPGYRKLDNPTDRAHMARFWGISETDLPQPGLSAYEMLDHAGAENCLKALLVFGSNLVISSPRARHIEGRLKQLELLVVSDFFLSETAQIADVVLPSLQWAEETGTMTNAEGRVLLRQAVLHAPGEARSDLAILAGLADRFGCGDKFSSSAPVVFNELRRASAGGKADYSGISYEKIRQNQGVFWPCPSPDHAGTPRLFLEDFPTPDGRARFHAVDFAEASEQPDREFPLYLTTGRVMAQYQSGNQTRRVPELDARAPRAFVEIHPATALSLGIYHGDEVRLTTRRDSTIFEAALTPTIRLDTVFVPFHYSGSSRANLLTNPALDPASRMPDFKVCAVRIEKVPIC